MTDNNKDLTASQMLYDARTSGRRKREISTVSRLLCIREEYLVALENGDYHLIPEVVYILGFARNYAMELGLDPDEVVNKIKRELGLEDECYSTEDEKPEEDEEELHPVIAAQKAKQGKQEKAAKSSSLFEKTSKYIYKHWKWLLTGLIALVIIIVGIIFVASLGGDKTQLDSEEVAAVAAPALEYKQTVREKFGTENAANAKVILQATHETWVKIEDARGNTIFSRVLVPGDVYYVPEGDKYKGIFGNAGGVDIWVNGKLAPKIGAMHTRKSGVSMAADSLMPSESSGVAE
jgi:cytoskeletal protein RodZ